MKTADFSAHPPLHVADIGPLPTSFAFEHISPDAYSTGIHGTVGSIMDKMDPRSSNALEQMYVGPSHVMQAIIESGLEDSDIIPLKTKAMRHALGFYAGTDTAEDHEALMAELDRHSLLGVRLGELHDQQTAQSFFPRYSQASAERIAEETRPKLPFTTRKDVLWLPILRGGLVPATQTALYYQRARPDANTTIYPVRVSTRKRNDQQAHLADGEAEHIKHLAEGGRLVALHDDDTQSGRTLIRGAEHMSKLLPRNRVVGIANVDLRGSGPQKQDRKQILVNRYHTR